MKNTQVVQCNVEWQVLRTATLPRYHPKGGWDTAQGTAENITMLRAYLEQKGIYTIELQRRTYRIRSLLLHVLPRMRTKRDILTYTMTLAFYNGLPPGVMFQKEDVEAVMRTAEKDFQILLEENPATFDDVRREIQSHLARAQGDQEAMWQFHEVMRRVANGTATTELR